MFAGYGAVVTNAARGASLGTVGIALVLGLVILAGIAAFGYLSGAECSKGRELEHFGPADALRS